MRAENFCAVMLSHVARRWVKRVTLAEWARRAAQTYAGSADLREQRGLTRRAALPRAEWTARATLPRVAQTRRAEPALSAVVVRRIAPVQRL